MSLIKITSYKDGLNRLVEFALNRELIPVFGAGFSAGCQASAGVVPDGDGARLAMSDLICESQLSPFTNHELDDMNFFDISDLFFEYVSCERRASYFEENYTNVKLYNQQIDFLMKINWPYAYTINVDDAIENNSDFSIVLPYHKFRRPQTSRKLLYKLHGDATYESRYLDGQANIVFSDNQYMQAITDERNSDIYGALLSDYGQRHLLFVGCSLQAEKDLQYIYEKSKQFQIETCKVILRTSEPSLKEQQNLKKHGINEIILVDSYEKFYRDFLTTYSKKEAENRDQLYAYINPTIKAYDDYDNSLRLLASGNIFKTEDNEFQKGSLHILRDAVKSVRGELEAQSCVLIKGRRLSGKTYCLCSLAEYYKSRNVYYFPSASYVDEDIIQKIFYSAQNGLFLFDSNSVTPDVYALIIKYAERLKERNNFLVVAANTNDNFLLSELQCNVIELSSKFSNSEISLSKKALDSFGLIRRRPEQTNIDYLYNLKNEQKIAIPLFFSESIQLSNDEKVVLIALTALDKLYNSDLVALNFTQQELKNLCKKFPLLIEVVPTTKNEVTRHSATKLVHNSKIALIEILKKLSPREISDSIQRIVKKYKPDYSRRRLYIEIILFDTINQLFATYKNADNLINRIYTELQPLLKDDLHYWLQRAKSIYRTTKSVESLNEAYAYAKKAYMDGDYGTIAKSALTISLILCAMAEKSTEDDRLSYYEAAVVYASESVFSEYFHLHPTYLNAELPVGKNTHSERRIATACKYVLENSKNEQYCDKSNEIIEHFEKLRKVMKKN